MLTHEKEGELFIESLNSSFVINISQKGNKRMEHQRDGKSFHISEAGPKKCAMKSSQRVSDGDLEFVPKYYYSSGPRRHAAVFRESLSLFPFSHFPIFPATAAKLCMSVDVFSYPSVGECGCWYLHAYISYEHKKIFAVICVFFLAQLFLLLS